MHRGTLSGILCLFVKCYCFNINFYTSVLIVPCNDVELWWWLTLCLETIFNFSCSDSGGNSLAWI